MRIGFFGDSYVDVFLHNKITDQHSWSYKLLQEYEAPILSTGHSGTNQFHAITEWKKFIAQNKKLDVAIWTFTWHDRLYSSWPINQVIFSAAAEKRQNEIKQQYKDIDFNGDPDFLDNLILAHELYLRYVLDTDQSKFLYSLMLKWILELPEQYKDTKFIFVPNTELANVLAKEHFTSGVLLDFAFETLSNLEIESPGAMPINCGRVGHINGKNINIFKELIKELIDNYQNFDGTIYKVDYNKFDIRQ